MAFRLSLGEDMAASVRGGLRAELEEAASRLERRRDDDPVGAVHGARKNLKKARALLRLVRSAIGAKSYKRENDALTLAARSISAARDADVAVQTADALAEQLPAITFDVLHARLTARADASRAAAAADDASSAALIAAVRAVADRVERWPPEGFDASAVRAGIGTTYRRGRRNFERVRRDPTVENLHDWRKRVKDLRQHHRLLADAWPALLTAYAGELRVLAEQLGDDHDLAVLAALLEGPDFEGALTPADRDAVNTVIAERRAELLAGACAVGARAYAERPKAFDARVASYLRAIPRVSSVPPLDGDLAPDRAREKLARMAGLP